MLLEPCSRAVQLASPSSTPLARDATPPAPTAVRLALSYPKKRPLELAMGEPVSSDPSEPSPLLRSSAPDFRQMLLSNLKPRQSSSGPVSTRRAAAWGKENDTGAPRGKGVMFSPDHLDSLSATPSHRYSPYARLFIYSAAPRLHGSPEPVRAAVPRPHLAPLELVPKSAAMPATPVEHDEDYATDDEAEAQTVEQLLLACANSQPSSSPIRVLSSCAALVPAVTPKSILKRWTLPIGLAKSTPEGSKKNGGRPKHPLNLTDTGPDAVLLVATVALVDVASGVSPYFGGTLALAAGGASPNCGSARVAADAPAGPSTSSAPVQSSAGQTDNGQQDGNGDDQGKPASTPVAACSSLPTDDPLPLLAPLLVLQASLSAVSAPYLSRRAASGKGKGPSVAEDTEMRGPTLCMPILLPEVERAYMALTRALVLLPPVLPSPDTTLRPLLDFGDVLLATFKRDLGHLSAAPSATPPRSGFSRQMNRVSTSSDSGSSPLADHAGLRTRKGLTAGEMRRMKDELQVTQVALKCVAAIAREERYYTLFKDSDLQSLVTLILAIPAAPRLSPSVIKDLVPFHNWFFSVQRLPATVIDPLAGTILRTLEKTLLLTDKARRNVSEGIGAIGFLITTHPDEFISNFDMWIEPVARGLWDSSKAGGPSRVKSLATLCALVKMLWTKWDRPGLPEDAARGLKREKLAERIATAVMSMMHRKVSGGTTNIAILLAQIDVSATNDEAGWALSTIALLPLLLGKTFRRFDLTGIKPWMHAIHSVRMGAIPMRSLTSLLWNHLMFAFLRASSTPTMHPFTSSWILRGDAHALSVLGQIFSHSAWRRQARMMLDVLVGIVYGLTAFPRTLAGSASWEEQEQEVAHFDVIWERVVARQLPCALESDSDDTACRAIAVLAAIVKPATTVDLRVPDRLFVPSFLDGSIAKLRLPSAIVAVAELSSANAIQVSELPGWSAKWIASNADELLFVFRACVIRATRVAPASTEWTMDDGDRLVPTVLLAFWRDFISTFLGTEEDIFIEGMQAVFTTLRELCTVHVLNMPTFAPLQRERLVNLLLITAHEILGDRLLAVPAAEHRPSFESLCAAIFALDSSFVAAAPTESTSPLPSTLLRLSARHAQHLAILSHATTALVGRISNLDGLSLCLDLPQAWTVALGRDDVLLAPEQASAVTRLFLLACSSTPSCNETAWLDFARLLPARFLSSLEEPSVCFSALLATAAHPLACISEFLPLLLATSWELPLAHQTKLVTLLAAMLPSMVRSDQPDKIARLSRAIEGAGDCIFVPVLVHILDALLPVVEVSSAGLHAIAAVLSVALDRALHPASGSSSSAAAIVVLCDFWRQTFNAQQIEIPEALCEPLSVLRVLASDLVMLGLPTTPESTQSTEESMEESLEAPPAGQRTSPVHESIDESLMAPPAGQYTSSMLRLEDFYVADSSLGSLPPSEPPSPSGYVADVSTSQATQQMLHRSVRRDPPVPTPSVAVREDDHYSPAPGSFGFHTSEIDHQQETGSQDTRKRFRPEPVADDSEDDDSPVLTIGRSRHSLSASSSKSTEQHSRKKVKTRKLSRAATMDDSSSGARPHESMRVSRRASRSKSTGAVDEEREVSLPKVVEPPVCLHNALATSSISMIEETRILEEVPVCNSTPPLVLVDLPSLSSSGALFAPVDQTPPAKEVIRMLLDLDLPDTQVVELAQQVGGSPAMTRLISLGKRAAEWFESFGGDRRGRT